MNAHKKNLRVTLEGHGPIQLTQNDYVASGGEGTVYRKGGSVIKIYHDADRMRRERLPDKIALLTRIRHSYIVSPKGLVLDANGDPIGLHMDHVDGEPLPRIFTNAFRARASFTDDDGSALVDRMRETVRAAHGSGAVMVDGNEFNWLAQIGGHSRKPEPRVIDVDSWAIGRWPASVIMPSIMDHHSRGFSQLTDWFAWGIVTFQVYAGIHPYKGTLSGYGPGDLERRMKANASVFSNGVGLNAAVRNFRNIPGRLLDWYVATFQHGERTVPPSPFESGVTTARIAQVKIATASAAGLVIHEKLFGESGDRAIRIFPGGTALLRSGRVIDLALRREITQGAGSDTEIITTDEGWLLADMRGTAVSARFIDRDTLTEHVLTIPVRGRRLFRSNDRLFIVTERGLTELRVMSLGKPVLAAGNTWGALPNSTRWFENVGIQDASGASYLIAPFGTEACAQIRVRELDGLVPVDAKAGHRFVAVVASDRSGSYHKLEFRFDEEYGSYKFWKEPTDRTELNLAILPRGICASIEKDGELALFVPSTRVTKLVADRTVTTDMLLDRWGEKVTYLKDGAVWQVRMK